MPMSGEGSDTTVPPNGLFTTVTERTDLARTGQQIIAVPGVTDVITGTPALDFDGLTLTARTDVTGLPPAAVLDKLAHLHTLVAECTAIFDTHVTTIVSAAILFMFGTGPVKGFAVTLSFGLFANLFTAVFVSRHIFDSILQRKQRGEALSIG